MHLSNGTHCPPNRTRAELGAMDWLNARKQEHEMATKSKASLQQSKTQHQTEVDITSSSPPVSKLLSLPPEIRNEIYAALFPPGEVQRIKKGYELPPFLLTCKQIHAEATGVYYSHSTFRCLEEDSTVSWLSCLPRCWLDRIEEIRYDTRWIIFVTPFVPVPGAEEFLFNQVVKRLIEKGFDVNQLGCRIDKETGRQVGEGRLKISFYGEGGVKWTDQPRLIESMRR